MSINKARVVARGGTAGFPNWRVEQGKLAALLYEILLRNIEAEGFSFFVIRTVGA
jgi:hypothetical protein